MIRVCVSSRSAKVIVFVCDAIVFPDRIQTSCTRRPLSVTNRLRSDELTVAGTTNVGGIVGKPEAGPEHPGKFYPLFGGSPEGEMSR